LPVAKNVTAQRGFQVEFTDPHWRAITCDLRKNSRAGGKAGAWRSYGDARGAPARPRWSVTIGNLFDTGPRASGGSKMSTSNGCPPTRRPDQWNHLARFSTPEVDLTLLCLQHPVTGSALMGPRNRCSKQLAGKPGGFSPGATRLLSHRCSINFAGNPPVQFR